MAISSSALRPDHRHFAGDRPAPRRMARFAHEAELLVEANRRLVVRPHRQPYFARAPLIRRGAQEGTHQGFANPLAAIGLEHGKSNHPEAAGIAMTAIESGVSDQ